MTISNAFFLYEKDRIPIWISLKFVPMSPIDNKQGSGNGSALKRWQAITRTNADLVQWHIYVALRGDKF